MDSRPLDDWLLERCVLTGVAGDPRVQAVGVDSGMADPGWVTERRRLA